VQRTVAVAIFGISLYAVLWLLRRYPHSRIARLALTWHGPFPQIGELRSSYLFRRSMFVAKLLCQAIVIFCGLGLIVRLKAASLETSPIVLVAMGFMVICALLFIAALAYLCSALKARWLGPNPAFVAQDDEPEV